MSCGTTNFLWITKASSSSCFSCVCQKWPRSEVYATSPNHRVSFALSGDILRVHNEEAMTLCSLYSGALPAVKGVSPCIIGHQAFGSLVDGHSWDDEWVPGTQESNRSKQCGGEHLKGRRDKKVLRPCGDYSCSVTPPSKPAQPDAKHDDHRIAVICNYRWTHSSLSWSFVTHVPFITPLPSFHLFSDWRMQHCLYLQTNIYI